MTRVDKTMLLAVLAGAAIAAVSASCANSCSGHGSCGTHDRCSCYAMWTGTDCSKKECPSGPSFTSDGYEVCSGRGVCDAASGTCACSEGYTGYNCGRTSCPNDCSGHGKCTSAGVDGGMTRACVCDGYYSGADCSFRQCPRGDDPLTTEIECQGVASGAQSHEVQEITLTADKQLSGEMTLTYTDAYGQSWTTMPIAVGGDLEYDLRISAGTGGCSLKYSSATLTSEKFRGSDDKSTDTDHDFAATEFTVPSVLAGVMTATGIDCDELSAANMQALLEQNGVVKNVKVTKSGDANTGTARFHVSIGDLNFQNENDGMEVGFFSMTGRAADSEFHSVGDRSQAIKDALQALPYNVVPSVDVSRVQVDGGSDYADSTVVSGNMVQQKYRVTFSDAANAGDQVSLQCNAEGCDADGCAPRYAGVTHKRYISTKYGSDPMDTTGGVTDYRTAIVATGQGSWWLRSHSLDVRAKSIINSGTYYVHWDLGNGKISSASFAYNADEAAIQTALRTIEGWSGVSVSCFGATGFVGRDYTGVAEANFGLECKVTYAKGFDDGGKLPTMTYDNIHAGMDAQEDTAAVDVTPAGDHTTKTHITPLAHSASLTFNCVNEMCEIGKIGFVEGDATKLTDGDYTSFALYTGAVGARDLQGGASFGKSAKQDNWIGYVYIRVTDAAGSFPREGTYEIVRVGSSHNGNAHHMSDLIIHAPGVADMTKAVAFGGSGAGNNAFLYKATPLMPMWPSFSNSIALHDTSFRVIYSPQVGANGPYHDAATTGLNTWPTGDTYKNVNIHYGADGAVAKASNSNGLFLTASTLCEGTGGILKRLNGFTGNGPYPSLASADGNSICDCKRTAMEVAPYEVEYTITCPGWLGYLINDDAVKLDAADDLLETSKESLVTAGQGDPSVELIASGGGAAATNVNIFKHHRRLTPERTLEQLVAVGDTVTVTASGANTNKQFKVKSFAYDNMWGDGSKGSAIWSAKAGYLGGDHANGFASTVALDSKIDYVSYGDYVPFLKVDPAPSDDYLITEMYTEGTNGTHFTRTLEDISTTQSETATLKVYDAPLTEASYDPTKNIPFNAGALSGTFQLIYDGELSPVIPVTSSANQVMEYLSQMTALTHVPAVSKTSGGTVDPDNTLEAVTAYSDYVSWIFTFDTRYGDAKKLTFKYTDAVTDEQKSSNIVGSGGAKLVNSVGSKAHIVSSNRANRYISNKIVMSYSSGSTFYDTLDLAYDGSADAVDGQGAQDKLTGKFHDELAMDVVPGTTIKVSSAEVHHMYMYLMVNEAATDNNDAVDAGCRAEDATNSKFNPHLVIEYNGVFTRPVPLCGASAQRFNTDTAMVGIIEADISALAGVSIVTGTISAVGNGPIDGAVQDTNIPAEFASRFSWAATHSGSAKMRVSITLPMGADGDSFKIHFQRGSAKETGISRYAHNADNVNEEFKIFTFRERNNNGRTFTVTKAYENKVSDLLSVSRVGALAFNADASEGGGLAGVIAVTNGTTGSWADYDATSSAERGCGTTINGAMTPGTYYNVNVYTTAGAATKGAGALLMVIVGGNGKVAEVQITSGGSNLYDAGEVLYFADTRMSTLVDGTNVLKRCTFVIGDASTPTRSNTLMKSAMVGADTTMPCLTVGAGNHCVDPAGVVTACALAGNNADKATCHLVDDACSWQGGCGIWGTAAAGADVTAYKMHNVPNNDANTDKMISGIRYSLECNVEHQVTKATITAGGGTAHNAGTGNRGVVNDATSVKAVAGSETGSATFATDCMNDHYYQFGFYNTGTPRWNRDLVQENTDGGLTPQDRKVTLYGMKTHMQYQFRKGTVNMVAESFYGIARDTFGDLNSGIGTYQAGYSITEADNDDTPQFTASVIAGENGLGANGADLAPMMEHAEKYAYIGRGYDKLTVTPMPDAMSDQKVTITYTGPSAGCSVTEVDRGTHESSECSGRGNCDYSTGTCLCDAGYTLEACSEQTVLV